MNRVFVGPACAHGKEMVGPSQGNMITSSYNSKSGSPLEVNE